MTPRLFMIICAVLAALVFVIVLLAPRRPPLVCEAPTVEVCPPAQIVVIWNGHTMQPMPLPQPCRCEAAR